MLTQDEVLVVVEVLPEEPRIQLIVFLLLLLGADLDHPRPTGPS
jgi:hypothetical protein